MTSAASRLLLLNGNKAQPRRGNETMEEGYEG